VKIVVGLGNPGKRYAGTPHNAGFSAIDELARSLECVLRRSFRFRSWIGNTVFKEENLLLVKPATYMNRSGTAVASILRHRKAEPSDMIVLVDDADLELGRLRIRRKGSSGGHKGLDSVVGTAESENFIRVRIGIGRNTARGALTEYVLTPLQSSEQQLLDKAVARAAQAVLCVIESGVEPAMNRFNPPPQTGR